MGWQRGSAQEFVWRRSPVPAGRRSFTKADQLLDLHRTAGNAAVTAALKNPRRQPLVVQRAIWPLHSEIDSPVEAGIIADTVKSLNGVKTSKTGQTQRTSGVRGAVIDDRGLPEVPPGEDLYVVGHGDSDSVGGLGVEPLATKLNGASPPEGLRADFGGQVKLVSCHSAETTAFALEPFAKRLQENLATKSKRLDLVIQGLAGAGRVHPQTGRIGTIPTATDYASRVDLFIARAQSGSFDFRAGAAEINKIALYGVKFAKLTEEHVDKDKKRMLTALAFAGEKQVGQSFDKALGSVESNAFAQWRAGKEPGPNLGKRSYGPGFGSDGRRLPKVASAVEPSLTGEPAAAASSSSSSPALEDLDQLLADLMKEKEAGTS